MKCVEGNGRTRWRGRRNRDELEPKRELERTCLIEDRQKLRDGGRCRVLLCLVEQESGASQWRARQKDQAKRNTHQFSHEEAHMRRTDNDIPVQMLGCCDQKVEGH